jgi:3',5'-cyclic AMP phosphodiesterase CpdA
MKKKYFSHNIIILILILTTCLSPSISYYIKAQTNTQYTFNQSTTENITMYPNAKFSVISDLHYYDNSLGTTGDAFENAFKSDRKLLKNSSELLDFAVDNILKSDSKFVLVSGDLTKDGELVCHQKAAQTLSRLREHGIKVFIVPGNHDVNNSLSYKYEGGKSISVPNITPTQFVDIYKDCGYNSAIYRDSNSLSYVAEPVDNLWVVALDTCRYKENKPGNENIISGRLSKDKIKKLLLCCSIMD